jgi:hypothetical protein
MNELLQKQLEPGFREVERFKERIQFYNKEISRIKV